MKKIVVLSLVALLVIGGVAFAASYTKPRASWRTGHGQGEVGGGYGKYMADPHRTFRLVRWKHADHTTAGINFTASADMLVVWDAGVSGDDGITVSTTTTTGDEKVAGVLVHAITRLSTDGTVYATEDVDNTNWAWIQTYGYCYVRYASPVVEGAGLMSASQPGLATDISSDASAPGTYYGFFYDAGSSGGYNNRVQAFIRAE